MWRYKDVESALGICERTVRRMVRRGDFPAPTLIGHGRTLGWPSDVVQAWVARNVTEDRAGTSADTCLPAPGDDAPEHHVAPADHCGS